MKCLLGILILISSSFGFERHSKPFEARIIGGEVASIENHPYQLSLEIYTLNLTKVYEGEKIRLDTWGCSAVLVTSEVALTAAHCVAKPLLLWSLKIRAGSDYDNRDGIVVDYKRIVIHPEYNYPILSDNDIAILILAQKLEFTKKIQPIPLPTGNFDVAEGLVGHVSGWGNGSNGTLTVVELPVANYWWCRFTYQILKMLSITDNQFCVGYKGGKGCCKGDSGGPFVSQGVLLGIVSFGGCAVPKFDTIFTKVSAHLDFIRPYLN